jgi:hypothetical protein
MQLGRLLCWNKQFVLVDTLCGFCTGKFVCVFGGLCKFSFAPDLLTNPADDVDFANTANCWLSNHFGGGGSRSECVVGVILGGGPGWPVYVSPLA